MQSSCIKLLTSSLQKLDDRWVVKPFGSSANGFSTKELLNKKALLYLFISFFLSFFLSLYIHVLTTVLIYFDFESIKKYIYSIVFYLDLFISFFFLDPRHIYVFLFLIMT